jgi:DNA polymerase III alpha subunit (gram-positive type)
MLNDSGAPPSTPHNPPSEPLRDGLWDLPVRPERLAFYDLEMTGLDTDRDEILEVALWLPREDGSAEIFHRFIQTSTATSAAARAIHGWTDEEIRDPVSPREALAQVQTVSRTRALVGHGVALDLRFLARAFERHLGPAPEPLFAIDTLDLARRAVKCPRYTLEAVTARLGLPPRRWHRADEDALGVSALFARLAPMFAPESLRDLWEVRVGQPQDRVRVRSAIARRLATLCGLEQTVTLVVRQSGAEPRAIRGIVERWSPPHVMLRRASGQPTIVRSDRILRIE